MKKMNVVSFFLNELGLQKVDQAFSDLWRVCLSMECWRRRDSVAPWGGKLYDVVWYVCAVFIYR
jgi:hypothetical protein